MNNQTSPLTAIGKPPPDKGLSAFLGVYTPTILTILGVIMYLRFGWVIGQVGLPASILIVLIANAITLITSLCLSAVATNTSVGVGGAYYIISRSLGLEIGGAIGIPLFLSQALSVTLYAFGLAESFRIVWPGIPVAAAAFAIIIVVGILSFRGADFALRAQIPVMVMIALSLFALAAGSFFKLPVVTAETMAESHEGFWTVFAVFFPAVTGIMAGLSLSGDLENPRSAIPRGTLAACLTGFAVYLLVPVLLANGADRPTLLSDPLVWTRIAPLGPWLILPGLWGAIFSSAVGSMLGAPRTLQALAIDRLAPGKLAVRQEGKEPVIGLAFTLAISLLAVFLGDLNTVATVVTMFFLSVYGMINLVASLERLSGNPSWRPTLNVPWGISLLGAAGCFGAMILIHLPTTLAALAIELTLWLCFKRRIRREAWGDLRRDLYESLIRWGLFRLAQRPMTARNWRPHILVFAADVAKRLDLVRFGVWFSENRGVVTVCELLQGDLFDTEIDIEGRENEIARILREEGLPAFGEINVVANIERGILAVTQANGMAGLSSNTVLVGFPDDMERLTTFLRIIRPLERLDRSLIIGNLKKLRPPREGKSRVIHVWWGGLKRNGDLMLLLAYLLSCNAEWRDTRIKVLSLASNDLMKSQTERNLKRLIPEIRIDAEIDIEVRSSEESISEIMRRKSAEADVVFLGLAVPPRGEEGEYARRLKEMVEGLPSCFLVHNGSIFLGDLVTPEPSPTATPPESR